MGEDRTEDHLDLFWIDARLDSGNVGQHVHLGAGPAQCRRVAAGDDVGVALAAAARTGARGVSAHDGLAGMAQDKAGHPSRCSGHRAAGADNAVVLSDKERVAGPTQRASFVVDPDHLGHRSTSDTGPSVTIGETRRAQRLGAFSAHRFRNRTTAVADRQRDICGSGALERPQESMEPMGWMSERAALVIGELSDEVT